MFARLLTPRDRPTDRLTYSKASAAAVSAAQVGLENGFGQYDRTAAGGAGGGEGEAAAEGTRMDRGGSGRLKTGLETYGVGGSYLRS